MCLAVWRSDNYNNGDARSRPQLAAIDKMRRDWMVVVARIAAFAKLAQASATTSSSDPTAPSSSTILMDAKMDVITNHRERLVGLLDNKTVQIEVPPPSPYPPHGISSFGLEPVHGGPRPMTYLLHADVKLVQTATMTTNSDPP